MQWKWSFTGKLTLCTDQKKKNSILPVFLAIFMFSQTTNYHLQTKLHYAVHKSPTVYTILRYSTLVYNVTSGLSVIHFNIILHQFLDLQWYLSWGFQQKCCLHFSFTHAKWCMAKKVLNFFKFCTFMDPWSDAWLFSVPFPCNNSSNTRFVISSNVGPAAFSLCCDATECATSFFQAENTNCAWKPVFLFKGNENYQI